MMHKTNNYCDIQDGCKIVKRLEAEKQKLKQSNNEKNDLLQKLGISATGEFHRIKFYIDKLVAENDRLKRYKDSKQASYERMQRLWNETEQENRELKQILKEIELRFGIKVVSIEKSKNLYYCSRIAKLEKALMCIGKILHNTIIPIYTAREKQIISKISEVLDDK